MKRWIIGLLVSVLFWSAAAAESLVDADYTDAPTVMTQDSVAELFANEGCLIETLQPDAESVALLNSVYRFVWEEKNRPARYYDEITQQKIAQLAGCDIDVLHMTEAMRLQLTGAPEKLTTATMRLDVEYYVGQLIIVVMGIPQGEGEYQWFPYRGRVETLGEIKWDIPVEDWALLCRQPISFHVLTDRIGPRGGRLWGYEEYLEETPPSFSKDSGDLNGIIYWYDEWGNRIKDDFRVWLVELTQPMKEEVARIGKHAADKKPILDYFPKERKDEAILMLPVNVNPDTLIVYDVIAMMDENYKDTYGDVTVEVFFGTSYDPEKAMVILAGFPIEEAKEAPYVEWYVLRAEALKLAWQDTSERVEIGLKQLFLPWMEEKPLMLVVMSEPLDTE